MGDSGGADAIFVGGPRDETVFAAEDTALVQLEIGGLVHRYIRTTQHRDRDGRQLVVYNYDGEIDPEGAESGAETR